MTPTKRLLSHTPLVVLWGALMLPVWVLIITTILFAFGCGSHLPPEFSLPDTPQELPGPLVGKWVNVRPDTNGVTRIEIEPDGVVRWWSPWMKFESEYLHQPGRLSTARTFNDEHWDDAQKMWSGVKSAVFVDNVRHGTIVIKTFTAEGDVLAVRSIEINNDRRNMDLIERYDRTEEFVDSELEEIPFPGYDAISNRVVRPKMDCSLSSNSSSIEDPREIAGLRLCGPPNPTRLECIQDSAKCENEIQGHNNCLPLHSGNDCGCRGGTNPYDINASMGDPEGEPTLAVRGAP